MGREKKKNNDSARRRMQKMNAKKRAEKSLNVKKVLTRKQVDEKKRKEAERKRNQRARYTPEQKKAVLARRREIYARKKGNIDKKMLEEERRNVKKLEESVAVLEVELHNRESEIIGRVEQLNKRNNILPEAVDMRSVQARRKALQRVKKTLPRRRSHNINTTIDLINSASPMKKAAFQEAGMAKDPVHEGVVEAVATGLAEPRSSSKRKALATVLHNIKRRKLQRAAAKQFGVSRKLLNNSRKKLAGRRGVPLATIKLIQEYYEIHSNPLPDKKHVMKKTMKPRHIMDKNISQLYQNFNKTHPDHQVSKGIFFRYRPKHVKTKAQVKYVGCLCEYCENIHLKIQTINAIQKSTFKDGYDVIKCSMCTKPQGFDFHHPSCINRKCSKCGVNKMDERLGAILVGANERIIKWKRWEMVTTTCYTKNGSKDVKKRKPIEKQGTVIDLVKELKSEVHPFAEHLFNKDWQNRQEKELVSKLQADEVMGVYDFAENFKCEHQREVQSAYYAHDSATLHPVVTYYSCPTCLNPVRESIIMVSDDLTHDYDLVHAFQQRISNHLTVTRGLPLTKFYRFSDGCSSQYKSKGPISDISYAIEDFDYVIHHNYSGTRHGKGASDGESGVMKKIASEAIKAGTAIISTPHQFFCFLESNVTKDSKDSCCIPFRRSVFFVKHEEVARERQGRAVRTVPGTRRLHSIRTVTGGKVATRNLSCFCDPCLRRCGGRCLNTLYVEPWKEVQLTLNKTDTVENSDHNSNIDTPQNLSPTPDEEVEYNTIPHDTTTPASTKMKVNAFVAVHFEATGSKATKGIVYMALVTDVKDKQLQLKFMRRINRGLYDFTLEREATHPMRDILQIMMEPTITQAGRAYLYEFNQQELDRLSDKFTLK